MGVLDPVNPEHLWKRDIGQWFSARFDSDCDCGNVINEDDQVRYVGSVVVCAECGNDAENGESYGHAKLSKLMSSKVCETCFVALSDQEVRAGNTVHDDYCG